MKRLILRVCVLVLAIGFGLYFSRGVWASYRDQRAATDRSMADMRRAENERVRLAREKSALDIEAGREALARQAGYVKDGETPLSKTSP